MQYYSALTFCLVGISPHFRTVGETGASYHRCKLLQKSYSENQMISHDGSIFSSTTKKSECMSVKRPKMCNDLSADIKLCKSILIKSIVDFVSDIKSLN